MWAKICIFAVTLVSCWALSHGQKYTDCGSVMGKVKNITISPPCGPGPKCILPSGKNVSLSIAFMSYEVAKQVKAVVHGIVADVPIFFPLPQPDACKNSGLKCPLQKGASYTYSSVLDIKKTYPKISLTVQWELKDESGKDLVCIHIPAEIQ